jgi:hypothetical protein
VPGRRPFSRKIQDGLVHLPRKALGRSPAIGGRIRDWRIRDQAGGMCAGRGQSINARFVVSPHVGSIVRAVPARQPPGRPRRWIVGFAPAPRRASITSAHLRMDHAFATRKLHKRLHTHRTFDVEQVVLNEKAPTCGAFAEPSDGLEPSTPSLPSGLGGGDGSTFRLKQAENALSRVAGKTRDFRSSVTWVLPEI